MSNYANKKQEIIIRRMKFLKNWWSRAGSNRRPPTCEAGALPTELLPHTIIISIKL